jgi:hypothetical protein
MRCMTSALTRLPRLVKQYGTKPGFYLIVGSNWKGEVPQDTKAVQPLLK